MLHHLSSGFKGANKKNKIKQAQLINKLANIHATFSFRPTLFDVEMTEIGTSQTIHRTSKIGNQDINISTDNSF